MVFNATFNNISVISWRSVLSMEETGIPEENHELMSFFDYSGKYIHTSNTLLILVELVTVTVETFLLIS